jgi:methionyl-tRNA formyltransferase
MRVLFGGRKERGRLCLEGLKASEYEVIGVLQDRRDKHSWLLGAPEEEKAVWYKEDSVAVLKPDICVLAGWSFIMKKDFLDLFPKGVLNLHAGKLPEYRGCSPLNWALLNGEEEIGLSIVLLDEGIDTGRVVARDTFSAAGKDIVSVTQIADSLFPDLMMTALGRRGRGEFGEEQKERDACYYPRRFPRDSLIRWNMLAWNVVSKIRALAHPDYYAFSFLNGHKISLKKALIPVPPYYFGESARIYKIEKDRFLIGTQGYCIWITDWEPHVPMKLYEELKDFAYDHSWNT